jgi:hypothetical protein
VPDAALRSAWFGAIKKGARAFATLVKSTGFSICQQVFSETLFLLSLFVFYRLFFPFAIQGQALGKQKDQQRLMNGKTSLFQR